MSPMTPRYAAPGFPIVATLYADRNFSVFRTLRNSDGKPFILKVLQSKFPSLFDIGALKHEFDILKNHPHPGLLEVVEIRVVDDYHCLLFEDFAGQTLLEYFHTHQPDLIDFLRIAQKITLILGWVHDHNIIHMDLKPANMLFNPDNKQVKITDFSLASLMSRELQEIHHSDRFVGTPAYMSPEQTGRMNRSIDYRTDFYSLGCTFYQLLTGSLPFDNIDGAALVHAHIAKRPTPPHERNPEIPQPLSDILMKLLEKPAEARYQSCDGLYHDLRYCEQKLLGGVDQEPFRPGSRDRVFKFKVSEKLYGREQEVRKLLDCLERTCGNSTAMMLVAGYSGIGKTTLIHELHKPIAMRRGRYAMGKFEQYNRDLPYLAVKQILAELVSHVLACNESDLDQWRRKLGEALGAQGRIITALVPELEEVVGPQPQLEPMSGDEAKFRFNSVFAAFLQAFTDVDAPTVFFLDDLQWADTASLNLLEYLLTQPQLPSLLILGAYRDNEVDESHPLRVLLEKLDKAGAGVDTLTLAPLKPASLVEMTADTLGAEPDEVTPLALLIGEKTNGNPFFAGQFLQSLYEKDLITIVDGAWHWDIDQIHDQGITDNVIDLLLEKINTIDQDAAHALRLASCIGHIFELKDLAAVCDIRPEKVADQLWDAVSENLILPVDGDTRFLYRGRLDGTFQLPEIQLRTRFKFTHDRIHQAAGSLVGKDEEQKLHLRLGELLLAEHRAGVEDKLFAAVHHLNRSQAIINKEDQRREVAALNLEAGRKAVAAIAYQSAVDLFRQGLRLLEDLVPAKDQLKIDLTSGLADTLMAMVEVEPAKKLYNELLTVIDDPLKRAGIHQIITISTMYFGPLEEGIIHGRQGLALMGITFPADPDEIEAMLAKEAQLLEDKLAACPLESLMDDLPEVSDNAALTVMNIFPPFHFALTYLEAETKMPDLVIHKALNYCLSHGLSEQAALIFMSYGYAQVSRRQNIYRGYMFGELALKATERFAAGTVSNLVLNCVAAWLLHRGRHVRGCIDILVRNNEACAQRGLYMDMLTGYFSMLMGLTFQGDDLRETFSAIEKGIKLADTRHVPVNGHMFRSFAMGYQHLGGFGVPEQDFANHLAAAGQYDDPTLAYILYINMARAHFIMGEYRQCLAMIEGAAQGEKASATLLEVEELFYHALTLAGLCDEGDHQEQVPAYRAKIADILAELKYWADPCPRNFMPLYQLVQAELARVGGDRIAPMRLYDQAVEAARREGFNQIAMVANELAGRFYLAQGRHKVAKAYLEEVFAFYRAAGCNEKLRRLARYFPNGLAAFTRGNNNSGTKNESYLDLDNGATSLDWEAFVKSSQAISGEIRLPVLLKKLIGIVMENAGAEKCFLLLNHHDELRVEAEAGVGRDMQRVSTSLAECGDKLGITTVNYVWRSKKSLVLNNAAINPRFADDPYIRTHRPKSLLCTPILRQGKLLAVLYLENNLITNAFTRERLKVLDILSSQAAISLENARLYSELEDYSKTLEEKVEQRTAQLTRQNQELEALDQIVETVNRQIEMNAVLKSLLTQGESLLPRATRSMCFTWTANLENYVSIFGSNTGRVMTVEGLRKRYLKPKARLDEGIFLNRFQRAAHEDNPAMRGSALALSIHDAGKVRALLVWENPADENAFNDVRTQQLARLRRHAILAVARSMDHDELKNKNSQIISSLQYAQRIQEANLPVQEAMERALPEHFVFYRPKDIVSGDFYWFYKTEGKIFITVVDCTGHGVPGGFISMLGHALLNKIVAEQKLEDPTAILEALDHGVAHALSRQVDNRRSRDGMDLALVLIEPEQRRILFSGAHRPLFIVRAGEGAIEVIKGSRKSINQPLRNKRPFETHELSYESGDMIYLATDGFPDQVSIKGEKFGNQRFRKLLKTMASQPCDAQREALKTALAEHQTKAEQRDDITCLGIRLPG